MLAGLGAALYAGGAYEEAARQLCAASDLQPEAPGPYLFLGKMDRAVPAPLSCVHEKLARFVEEQPGNALAHYYYAMTLSKRERGSEHPATSQQIKSMLEKAVALDPKLAEAQLQLGIVQATQGHYEQAVTAYRKAVGANPHLAEAHYWLGRAYKQLGEEDKARQEFEAYQRISETEAGDIERQRSEVRQFLVVLKDQPAASSPW